MIEALENFKVFTVVSKLLNKPLRLSHGNCSDDITSVKRGARLNNDLDLGEAYYIALTNAGLLSPFQHYAKDSSVSLYDFTNLSKTIDNKERHLKTMGPSGYTKEACLEYEHSIEALRIAKRVEADAQAVFEAFGGRLVHWNKLTSVQFYCYDSSTNSMVEYDHVTTPVRKSKK